MTSDLSLPNCPGLQVPDGNIYRAGLIRAWAKHAPGSFPVAMKLRQSFPEGNIQAAIAEAAALFAVARLHVALIPKWDLTTREPDWTWLRERIGNLALVARATDKPIFVRIENWGEKNEAGGIVSFSEMAEIEAEFGRTLRLLGAPLSWAVGDDRGMAAAVDGWLERRRWLGSDAPPAMLEIQDYGERRGIFPDHLPRLVAGLRYAGFGGDVALVEFHRIFKPKGREWTDFARLADQETGEYLREIHAACAGQGVGLMVFTGNTAFQDLDHTLPLNAAGVALFDHPRAQVKPWRPGRFRAWRTTLALS